MAEDKKPKKVKKAKKATKAKQAKKTNKKTTDEAQTAPPSPQQDSDIVSASVDFDEDELSSDLIDETEHLLEAASIAYEMSRRWADFHIYITSPVIQPIDPPVIIPPQMVEEGDELEHVYPIVDRGYCLSTSRGEELCYAGMSMCKLYYTIEKMIALLVERLEGEGNVTPETEVRVAFSGFELAQRKGFESVINLNYNVIVTNFEPGAWGEKYLATVKRLADKGYGYPSETPRDSYRHSHAPTRGPKR